jgi:hypothetical protein
VHDLRQPLERLMRASARLGVDNPDDFRLGMCVERGGDLIERENIAPCRFDGVNRCSAAFHYVLHPPAEHAIHANDCLVPGLDEVRRDAFHPGHAGAAHRERQRVLRAENLPQLFACLVHNRDVLRIEMSERRRTKRPQHTVRHRAWAWAHEDAFDGIRLRSGGHHEERGGVSAAMEYGKPFAALLMDKSYTTYASYRSYQPRPTSSPNGK